MSNFIINKKFVILRNHSPFTEQRKVFFQKICIEDNPVYVKRKRVKKRIGTKENSFFVMKNLNSIIYYIHKTIA